MVGTEIFLFLIFLKVIILAIIPISLNVLPETVKKDISYNIIMINYKYTFII